MSRWLTALVVAAVSVGTATPATAHLPGRNGSITWATEIAWVGVPCLEDDPLGSFRITGGGSAWSPRGKKAALVVDDGTDVSLWVLWTDGCQGRSKLLTVPDGWGNAKPTFSPDGRQVAVDNTAGGFTIVAVGSAPGGGAVVREFPSGSRPSWSPEGGTIAVERDGGIYLQPVDGGAARFWKSNASFPDFSPDGSMIAYLQDGTIRYASVRTGRQVRATEIQAQEFTWSPDGRFFLYTDRGEECLVATITGKVAYRVPGSFTYCTGPSWQPL